MELVVPPRICRRRRSSACSSSPSRRSSRPSARGWRASTASSAPDGEVLVNELNTIPGFTATSVYAKLFEATRDPVRGAARPADRARARATRAPARPRVLAAGRDLVDVGERVEPCDPDEVVARLRPVEREASSSRRRCGRPRRRPGRPVGESPALISAVKPGVSVRTVSDAEPDLAPGVEDEADAGLRERVVGLGRPVVDMSPSVAFGGVLGMLVVVTGRRVVRADAFQRDGRAGRGGRRRPRRRRGRSPRRRSRPRRRADAAPAGAASDGSHRVQASTGGARPADGPRGARGGRARSSSRRRPAARRARPGSRLELAHAFLHRRPLVRLLRERPLDERRASAERTSGRRSSTFGAGSFTCCIATATKFSPSNGTVPVSSSKRTTPNE